jgi:phosphoribosyl 1,2-cyclic phosphate phosphodiesterase
MAVMELLLLGSAAAEGCPAPFCECDACQGARRRGGVELRTRTGALVDKDLKIDFSPDTLVQMQRLRRSLRGVRTIVFTHEHSDHLCVGELQWMTPPFARPALPQAPVQVFGNTHVIDQITRQAPADVREALELCVLEPCAPATTRDGDVILPLPADHSEGALVLRITRSQRRGGKTLFYGHDSARYPKATLDALGADGTPLDIALFDCTYGCGKEYAMHMSLDGVVAMVQELRIRGALTERSRLIGTHFSHNGAVPHDELCRTLARHGIEAAYDGMLVTVP